MLLGGLSRRISCTAIDVMANTAPTRRLAKYWMTTYNTERQLRRHRRPGMPARQSADAVRGSERLCTVTNTLKGRGGEQSVDLSITKTDDGLDQVAGGDSFNYTITVDNLGPDDPSGDGTVTDELPPDYLRRAPVGCSRSARH